MVKRKPTSLAKALSRYFFDYLPAERGLSEQTIQSYRDAISLLMDFCKQERGIPRERLEVSDLTRDLIEAYLLWLEQEKGSAVSTRNQRRAAINASNLIQLRTADLRITQTANVRCRPRRKCVYHFGYEIS